MMAPTDFAIRVNNQRILEKRGREKELGALFPRSWREADPADYSYLPCMVFFHLNIVPDHQILFIQEKLGEPKHPLSSDTVLIPHLRSQVPPLFPPTWSVWAHFI